MHSSLIAAAALMVSAASAQGVAKVINGCKYPVKLCNTPSDDGVHTQIDKVLAAKTDSGEPSPDSVYEQTYTELVNYMGWSIKLGVGADSNMSNIMQFEYTYLSKGIILWYDISAVDGNPWDGNWELKSVGECTTKHKYYRYSTDDAFGMQHCPVNSDITLLLCSGESQNDGVASSSAGAGAGSAPASSAAPSSYVAPTTSAYVAPTTTADPEPTSQYGPPAASGHMVNENDVAANNKAVNNKVLPTTLATLASSSTPPATTPEGVIVTEYATAVVTEVVTATAYAKRDQHAHHHAHHPHARA